ncbi:MAG TPA: DEAD/DEAH box helicase [Candidatus Deferrimicrobium sp.]|nr:DEAD/DEAH box helicase [Candidatus Deferrimicrobium sp.]
MGKQASAGFEKLAKKVQRWIWDRGWTELRAIQEEAIMPLLSAENDVIIASATASGKTEAAYLPICSYLVDNPGSGIRVLYISPLKALIDDQYRRLEELCEYCDIQVQRWHGDVGTGEKKKLLERPTGLLLITPESLEAIFVNHGTKIAHLFNNLSYIIIDELHAFLDNERGKQLQSLLNRLELVVNRRIPHVGLSATLGDLSIAAAYLRADVENEIKIIESKRDERELKIQIRGYKELSPDLNHLEADCTERMVEHLFNTLRGSDNLIFANTRTDVEDYSDRLRQKSEELNLPNEFFPHHGNLSKDLRQDVERRLQDRSLPSNVVCTTTLEMGIDIGSVKSIAQIGCPFSVAGMRQRLGRSGRKEGDPSILRVYIQQEKITEKSHPGEMLRENLFQSAAMVELLIRKWVEPPDGRILHLSTLIQQLLSIIAQYGGIRAEKAWKALCSDGPFQAIGQKEFIQLLRNLGSHDILTQMHDGTLVLGIQGERIVNHYTFYAAFVTYDEYRLISIADGKTLGSLPINYPVFKDLNIIFAGRRWIVEDVNDEQKVILLRQSPGRILPLFTSGETLVHDEIRKEMLKLYLSDYIPVYLDKEAVKLFMEGRDNFKRLNLAKINIMSLGKNTLLFPWIGDKSMNALLMLFMSRGLKILKEGFMIEIPDITPAKLITHLEYIAEMDSIDAVEMASIVGNKTKEKYDRFLPEDLLCAEYASRSIDIKTALESINSILKKHQSYDVSLENLPL